MSNPSEKLLIAAANGNLENVIQELKNNANINATDLNGYAPIHCAVYNNKVEAVKYLVKNGANVLLKDSHAYVGFTPLHYASAFGSIEMVKALLLSNEKDLHCKNSTGQTPADVSSNFEVKELLLNDEKLRKGVEVKTEKIVEEQYQVQSEQQQQQQQQQQPLNEQDNCCDRSKCCKVKKIGKAICWGIIGLLFFGSPAVQFFFNPEGFPLYLFPCALIIWIGGLVKIACKSKKCEKMREKKGLLLHGWTVLNLNVLVIIINLLSTPAPWWIIVALITGAPLAVHKILKKGGCCGKKEFKGLSIHGVLYVSFLVGSYVLYCLTHVYEKSFFGLLLWFLPSAVWTVGFAVHVHLVKKRLRNAQNVVDVEVPVPNNQNNQNNVQENAPLRENNFVEQERKEQSTIYPQVL